jgi:1-acyl-sn-glycerol-3-phosphate acyltransferase
MNGLLTQRVRDRPVAPASRHLPIVRGARRRWWMPIVYVGFRLVARGIGFCTLRAKTLRPELAEGSGGYVLACSHLSHIEPFIVGALVDRQIDWMSRIEFYRRWWSALFLHLIGAFPVNRQGVPVSALRTAIDRAGAGRVIGMFPEGGVVSGADSVCRGGKIKRGVCFIAYRANVPAVPCVVIGTDKLNAVGPWLPFRRARVWLAFGDPVWADRTLRPKIARQKMAEELERMYVALYRELLNAFKLDERPVP